jgi:uncharacterized protein
VSGADNPNLAVQERFIAAVFAGDTATLTALCAPDFVLEQGPAMPYAGTYRGAEGFLRFLDIFAETLDIERLEPVRTYGAENPDWLVSEFVIESRVKASGARYDTTLLERWQFRDGKVASIRPHYFAPPASG